MLLVGGKEVTDEELTSALDELQSSFPDEKRRWKGLVGAANRFDYYNDPTSARNQSYIFSNFYVYTPSYFKGLKSYSPKRVLEYFERAQEEDAIFKTSPYLKADLNRRSGDAQLLLKDWEGAQKSFAKVIEADIQMQNTDELEEIYKILASQHKERGTIDAFQKKHETMLQDALKTEDETAQLEHYIALGSIYEIKGEHDKAVDHYSKAYERYQGKIDKEAYRVEQGEVALSDNEKLGTGDIWGASVAVVVHDPLTKKTALAHVSELTEAGSLSNVITKNFPNSEKLEVHLVGGQKFTDPERSSTADENISKVLSELKKHSKVDIVSADIGEKIFPSAIVFDPQKNAIAHAVPGKIEESTAIRKTLTPQLALIEIQEFGKARELDKARNSIGLYNAFDLTKSKDIPVRELSSEMQGMLVQLHLSQQSSLFGDPLWVGLASVYQSCADAAKQIQKTSPEIYEAAVEAYKKSYGSEEIQQFIKSDKFKNSDEFKEAIKGLKENVTEVRNPETQVAMSTSQNKQKDVKDNKAVHGI